MARFSVRTTFIVGIATVVLAGGALAFWLRAGSAPSPASTTPAAETAAALAQGAAAAALLEKPLWKELSPAQQRALEPLAGEWDKLEARRKQKWLEIANRFGSMKTDEQLRVQERMREWVKLTPAQRRQVRESYARTQKITPSQKSAQWEQYQQLPEDEKKQLADKASAKKQVVNPPTPAQSKIQTVAPVKRQLPPPATVPPAPAPVTPPVAPAPAPELPPGETAPIPNAANVVPVIPATPVQPAPPPPPANAVK